MKSEHADSGAYTWDEHDRGWDLPAIIAQLESCNYVCEAGPLENNVAWRALRQFAGLGPNRPVTPWGAIEE